MAIVVPNPNVLLGMSDDKLGHLLIELKTQLVASGRWRVRGSGTGGTGGTFQLMGQTAGVGGSFDVFTASTPYVTDMNGSTVRWFDGGAGTISRASAWMVLEEVGSGRCLTIQRADSSGGQGNGSAIAGMRFSNAGVASSGAAATAPPASVAPVATLMTNTNVGSDLMNVSNAHWFQLGVANAAEAGGACPFWWALYNRTAGTRTWGMLYDSLTDTAAGDLHPHVIGTAVWATFFNDQFSNSRLFGGATLAARGLTGYTLLTDQLIPNVAPSAYSQPIGPDGFWRTYRPIVLDESGVFVGRSNSLLLHPINREYPTTYKVATPDARLVLGQLLVPWKQGTAPSSTP